MSRSPAVCPRHPSPALYLDVPVKGNAPKKPKKEKKRRLSPLRRLLARALSVLLFFSLLSAKRAFARADHLQPGKFRALDRKYAMEAASDRHHSGRACTVGDAPFVPFGRGACPSGGASDGAADGSSVRAAGSFRRF